MEKLVINLNCEQVSSATTTRFAFEGKRVDVESYNHRHRFHSFLHNDISFFVYSVSIVMDKTVQICT